MREKEKERERAQNLKRIVNENEVSKRLFWESYGCYIKFKNHDIFADNRLNNENFMHVI